MDLDGGKSIRGPFEGVGLEIETFLGPEMATSAASAIGIGIGFGFADRIRDV
jgi:hypothetical protein